MQEAAPANFLTDYPRVLIDLLWHRGLKDEDQVLEFLYPRLSSIPSPIGCLHDLDEALKVLLKVRDRKESLVVFGDFDVDGATSTALLVNVFQDLGWKVSYFVPHRVNEGYGVTAKAIERLMQENPRVSCVVTCDCGVSSFEGISILKEKGVSVVVTDHHEPPPGSRVSADAVLNPKQKACLYPDKRLAGVGVAFLLAMALRRALNAKDYSLNSHLDLVCLGTVCDLADLQGVNRVFVKAGLITLANTERLGLQALKEVAGVKDKQLSARDLGFVLGPRLNAIGRMGDPKLGIELLLSRDRSDALQKALALEGMNRRRRELQQVQVQKAEQEAAKISSESSIVLWDAEYHLGLVGLVASRLAENFEKPSCVLTRIDDEHELANYAESTDKRIWKGSLRSRPGVHLANTLQAINTSYPGLLKSFGGHSMAAGVAMLEENVEQFASVFKNFVQLGGVQQESRSYDLDLHSTQGLEKLLGFLEPIGQANPAPCFMIQGAELLDYKVLKEEHLKLKIRYLGQIWSVLQFRSPWVTLFQENDFSKSSSIEMDLGVELMENEWRGEKGLEFRLLDLVELRQAGRVYEFKQRQNEIGESKSSR